jgi:hypothetical protein
MPRQGRDGGIDDNAGVAIHPQRESPNREPMMTAAPSHTCRGLHRWLFAAVCAAATAVHAQTTLWSATSPANASGRTQRWSEVPGPRAPASPSPRAVDVSGLPVVPSTRVPGQVEIRSGCDRQFADRRGPRVDIRWFGVTQSVILLGRRSDGDLCALYEDGTSEWIAAEQVMTPAEKQAHDRDMQTWGAGLQRSPSLSGKAASPQETLDRLRETGNALHRETQEQYRRTEQHYEDKRRYGRP